MYNRIVIVLDNQEPQTYNLNMNDRGYATRLSQLSRKAQMPEGIASILAYAKIVGREEVPFSTIEKWVDDHDVYVDVEAPKASLKADTTDTFSESPSE